MHNLKFQYSSWYDCRNLMFCPKGIANLFKKFLFKLCTNLKERAIINVTAFYYTKNEGKWEIKLPDLKFTFCTHL